ncbi:PTS system mannose/fructose/sorbose family transporter subunit IID [Enterococcus faecium]|nr:PTS system mannose/fructose/sorbose family transporter subunit IID [Enterococcus faecium]MDQ8428564.1 PTS system mannose/fructose/sorbose family transporter subunit IID [Enterococcus faecium]MDQ8448548.1 PTS system mannose/fructose/sorbose family transporter subunit IID [Enterococcus faecium]
MVSKSKKNVLKRRDYMKAALRSYIFQNSFNYNVYQGVGYLNILMPSLKKIYKDNPEKLKETAKANLEFYNTNPQMVPFVSSMQLAMYDNDQCIEDTRSIKMALMGPLSGIGDSIAQFGLAPLFSTIFAGLALDGLGFAPMGFWLIMIVSMLAIKLSMGYLGYKLGTSVIETLSEKISKISAAANIIGVTVISGLAATFVKANIAIKYTSTVEPGAKQVVALQEILDKIMPNLLPVIITALVFYLIRKKKWNTYRLLILLFVIGILSSLFGILE